MKVDYSTLRKRLQEIGEAPEWYTTAGIQLFYEKYSFEEETPKSRYESIAKAMAQHAPSVKPDWWETDSFTKGLSWEEVFFKSLWEGFISPSTPLLANGGIRKRGTTVSCAGGNVGNNLFDRYNAVTEAAILTKHSHGTSYSIDDWPAEGEPLRRGGYSLGVMPIIRDFINCMDEVTQASRRGSLAYSIGLSHGDFYAVADNLYLKPESNNVGWLIKDSDVAKMRNKDKETLKRFQRTLEVKLPRGRGYYTFIDKCNRHLAEAFKLKGLKTNASNLCVAPETQILTEYGYFPIADLEGQTINVWNGEQFSETTVVKTGENQKLLKVTTSGGQVLECTPYHKFYVAEGYTGRVIEKRTNELQVGDKLIKFELPVIEGGIVLTKAYQNGFFSADGCVVNGKANVYFYGEKRKLVPLFDLSTHNTNESMDREIGRVDGLKPKFFVPDATYTVESRLEWLAGYLDGDGCVYRNGNNQQIVASSVEPEFLREIQRMLQTLGVSAKVTHMSDEGVHLLPANNGTGEYKEYLCQKSERLLITSCDVYRLMELGLGDYLHRLRVVKRLPQRDAKQFVKIVSVEDEGRVDDTYCFTEKLRGMGMFNGILTGQCQETNLPSNEEYTFSCVILCYNLELWDKWPEHLVQIGQVMSDCNISEYLETMDEMTDVDKLAMRKIYKFTKEFRSLGSGVLGWHTLMQMKSIPVASMDAMLLNDEIFSRLDKDSREATKWLASVVGEPEGCKGLGIRNATRLMMPPTKSTAEIMAGASEGIGLDVAMVFTKQSAGGEFFRINKVLLKLMKERGVYNDDNINALARSKGSVQQVDWLTDHEKKVFLTAFEIPMEWVINLAAQRQKYIDQGQSLNLYFTSNDSEEYISKIHRMAMENEDILSLYYIYSVRGADGLVRDLESCEMCQ